MKKYGRKESWIVLRIGMYGRKISWIVNRYGKYGRKSVEYWKDMENMKEKTEKIWKIRRK